MLVKSIMHRSKYPTVSKLWNFRTLQAILRLSGFLFKNFIYVCYFTISLADFVKCCNYRDRKLNIHIWHICKCWSKLAGFGDYIGLATKWLWIFSIPPSEKIRNHLIANPIFIEKEKEGERRIKGEVKYNMTKNEERRRNRERGGVDVIK